MNILGRLLFVCWLGSGLVHEGQGASVTWDGGGGDLHWQNPANWSGDVLPGATDDVAIAVPGSATILLTHALHVTLRSLQCSNSLAMSGGSLRLTAGASRIEGGLLLSGNSLVLSSATGSGLTVSGELEMTAGNLTAAAGAVISITGLSRFSKPPGCFTVIWRADGPGSVLEMPALTNLVGAECATLGIEALRGGRIVLPALSTISEGQVNILADGMGSVVEHPQLSRLPASLRPVLFDARNNGRIEMPGFEGGPMAVVSIRSGGVLPVDRLAQLRGFTVGAATIHFSSLTNLGGGNLVVDSGGVVSASNIVRHAAAPGCVGQGWSVSGTGSALSFPALTHLTGPRCGALIVKAQVGGHLMLSNVVSVLDGSVTFAADGAASLVDLGSLESCPGVEGAVSFEARNRGEMRMPRLPGGFNVAVTLGTGGVLPVAQLRQLQGFSVDAMEVVFPGLLELGSGDITVSGGGVASVPLWVGHSHPVGCRGSSWVVTGEGSRLDLSSMTHLSGASCGALLIQAVSGGEIDLRRLPTIANGVVSLWVDGTNSLINLALLKDTLADSRAIAFEAINRGTLSMPVFQGGPTVTVTIRSGGVLDATQMTLLKGLIVSATSLEMPGITRLFSGDVRVEQGGLIRFPNLASHVQGSSCTANSWTAVGAGSLLDLTSLRQLEGAGCGVLTIEALSGGRIAMGGLRTITEGWLAVLADGAQSVVGMESLIESQGTRRPVSFEVRNQGTILIPAMGGGATVGLTLRSNGVMSVSGLGRIGSLAASQAAIELSALTNCDSCSFTVTNGAVVSAPNLRTYAKAPGCFLAGWTVRGTGSVLNLPGLSRLAGGNCPAVPIEAWAGGRVLLTNLTHIAAGSVALTASGAASLIDLSSLENFVDIDRNSRLTATNGGTIELGGGPMVTSGVEIRLGSDVPPSATNVLGRDELILHGNAWHSYRVEHRASADPSGVWTLFGRIPLTNGFQIIGGAVHEPSEFLAREFVSDPAELELTPVPGEGVGLVLYGPPAGLFEVVEAPGVETPRPWALLHSVAMTNTFRILPLEPLSIPMRYLEIQPAQPARPGF